jgi:predicted dehydrogenase
VHHPLLAAVAAAGRADYLAVVDRPTAEAGVRAYLVSSPVAPPLTLVEELTPAGLLHPRTVARLDALVARDRITTVLVATEPLAHEQYARWALSRRLHVLIDKPPTARDLVIESADQARLMVDDFSALADASARSGRCAWVLAQRRYHKGFRYIRTLIQEVRQRTGCPPTSITVEHADGEWRLPWEVLEQEYHPFNRGYGVLLHSGYHAVDIALWLTGITGPRHAGYESVTVTPHFTLLEDLRCALPDERIHRLLGCPPRPPADPARTAGLGELDARLLVELHKDGVTPTVLSIGALHTSFSMRGWLDTAGRNLYTGNGRRVHETMAIHQGPFQTIRLHSYRALTPGEPDADRERVGGTRHWVLQVFRNSALVPEWQPVTALAGTDVPDDPEVALGRGWVWPGGPEPGLRGSVNAEKQDLVADFLRLAARADGGPPAGRSEADVASHQVTVAVIGAAYEAWAARSPTQPATVTVKLGAS